MQFSPALFKTLSQRGEEFFIITVSHETIIASTLVQA